MVTNHDTWKQASTEKNNGRGKKKYESFCESSNTFALLLISALLVQSTKFKTNGLIVI